tara:strand:- start:17 stop:202 length:186 start_codon:yes stop_codon:yes gene_type:complete
MLEHWDTDDLLESYYNKLGNAAFNMRDNNKVEASNCLLASQEYADELKRRNVNLIEIKPAN